MTCTPLNVSNKSSSKVLAKLPIKTQQQFFVAFRFLSNGITENLDIKPLQGRDGYRLRIGNYRAIYHILEDELIIEVVKIGSRGDVYK